MNKQLIKLYLMWDEFFVAGLTHKLKSSKIK